MANHNPNTKGLIPIKKGVSGNPGGMPVGARNRLNNQFLTALADSFQKHGKAAIQEVIEKKPDRYLMIIASLMPREVNVTRPLDGMTDEELLAIAEELRSQLGVAEDRERDRTAIEGTTTQ